MCIILFLLGMAMNHESFNEYFEHKWIKSGSSFHNFMHRHDCKFTHTGEKSSDCLCSYHANIGTLKISLFNNVAYAEWMDEMFSWGKDRKRNDETMGPARPWPVGYVWPEHVKRRPWKRYDGKEGIEHILKAIQHGNIIQGFFQN